MAKSRQRKTAPAEIPVIGEVDSWEGDVVKSLLDVPPKGECVFYIDSAGGSVFGALAVTVLLRQRQIDATGIVLGECSSATLLLFAACRRRVVTPHSTLFFHKMRWQSDKRVDAGEASLWAKHFGEMEKDIDALQARLFGRGEEQVRGWINSSSYVSGRELVAVGLAEMLEV
jgi:ATP-dependent protease ClpP protease subunit